MEAGSRPEQCTSLQVFITSVVQFTGSGSTWCRPGPRLSVVELFESKHQLLQFKNHSGYHLQSLKRQQLEFVSVLSRHYSVNNVITVLCPLVWIKNPDPVKVPYSSRPLDGSLETKTNLQKCSTRKESVESEVN